MFAWDAYGNQIGQNVTLWWDRVRMWCRWEYREVTQFPRNDLVVLLVIALHYFLS